MIRRRAHIEHDESVYLPVLPQKRGLLQLSHPNQGPPEQGRHENVPRDRGRAHGEHAGTRSFTAYHVCDVAPGHDEFGRSGLGRAARDPQLVA